MKTTVRKITVNGESFEYLLTFKKVKNVNMRLNNEGMVCVSAPKYASVSFVDSVVAKHFRFIVKSREKIQRRKSEKPVFNNGDRLVVWGEKYILELVPSQIKRIETADKKIVMYLPNIDDEGIKDRLWLNFLKTECEKKALLYYDSLCKIYAAYTNSPNLRYKYMSSRWGSCSLATNSISINIKLAKYPEGCFYYVLVHEFTHFIHQNHSKAFYLSVEKVFPDWKKYSDMLKFT